MYQPQLVALSAVLSNGNILLIKRHREPYKTLWSLPGGKVNAYEHIEHAAVREVKEETNLDCKFERVRGIASEIVYVRNKPKYHFILFVCELRPKVRIKKIKSTEEGKLKWFKLSEVGKENVIPSDYRMIKEFIIRGRKKYQIYKTKVLSQGMKYFIADFRA